MLQLVRLLLPAMAPSWRFFDVIAPSPRIEYAPLNNPEDSALHWQEFRKRPAQLSFRTMLKRLFFNPEGNESLFLVSCAERMIANPTEQTANLISSRIRAEVKAGDANYLRFRLVFVNREGDSLQSHVLFQSEPQAV